MVKLRYFLGRLFIKQSQFIVCYIINDIVLDTPFDEIQLCESCLDFMRCTWNGICKLLRSTKWVEKLFTVPIKA